MVQPHYGKTLIQPGGWDVDSIRRHFRTQLEAEFGAFGILGEPYPFHAGVLPPAQCKGRQEHASEEVVQGTERTRPDDCLAKPRR
jgi:hypothetical protein